GVRRTAHTWSFLSAHQVSTRGYSLVCFFFFQAEDGIRDGSRARGAANCGHSRIRRARLQLARYTEANMDQGVQLKRTDRIRAVERLRDFIVRAVDGASAVEAPFYHLQLDQGFLHDVYASMLTAMPEAP